jgi:hypothetical protein
VPFKNSVLVHHHIEQGPWAVGIPEPVHHSFYPELHPITNPWGIGVIPIGAGAAEGAGHA